MVEDFVRRPPTRHLRRHLSIGLTHRCQNRCDFCATAGYRTDAAGELSTSEVEELLRAAVSSRYVFHTISFIGGECLLRRDLAHLVGYAARLGVCVHLSTNGLKLDDHHARLLAEAGLNSVFVAVAPEQPPSDALRRALEACGRHGLPCFLSVCVRREHVASRALADTIAQAKRLGAVGVRLLPARLSGRWLREDRSRALDERELAEVRRLCRSGFAFLTDDASAEAGRACGAVLGTVVYVSPYGEVQPCHFFPFSFGNTRQQELDSALARMWSHELLQHDCYDCLLHDPEFRREHVLSLSEDAPLPVAL